MVVDSDGYIKPKFTYRLQENSQDNVHFLFKALLDGYALLCPNPYSNSTTALNSKWIVIRANPLYLDKQNRKGAVLKRVTDSSNYTTILYRQYLSKDGIVKGYSDKVTIFALADGQLASPQSGLISLADSFAIHKLSFKSNTIYTYKDYDSKTLSPKGSWSILAAFEYLLGNPIKVGNIVYGVDPSNRKFCVGQNGQLREASMLDTQSIIDYLVEKHKLTINGLALQQKFGEEETAYRSIFSPHYSFSRTISILKGLNTYTQFLSRD